MTLGAMDGPVTRDGVAEQDWVAGLPHGAQGWGLDERTIIHLVLLDGRLVDTWQEPAEGTRWEHLVRAPARPVVQLPHDENQDLLDWLTALCGSRAALDALTDEQLGELGHSRAGRGAAGTPPDDLDELLVRLADVCFDSETLVAMRRAATLLERGRGPGAPDLTAHQRASGIAWAVGKANGLFGTGLVSIGAVQHALGLSSTITASGRAVERALVGPLPFPARRPRAAPDLLVLGRPDLLLGATRRALVAWRDRAVAAVASAAARHPCTVCSPL